MDQTSSFTVLQDGKNVLLPVGKLVDHVSKNVNVYRVPVSYTDFTQENLGDLLSGILRRIGTDSSPVFADAANVSYTPPADTMSNALKVSSVLDQLCKIIYGVLPFPTSATDDDINGLFTI